MLQFFPIMGIGKGRSGIEPEMHCQQTSQGEKLRKNQTMCIITNIRPRGVGRICPPPLLQGVCHGKDLLSTTSKV